MLDLAKFVVIVEKGNYISKYEVDRMRRVLIWRSVLPSNDRQPLNIRKLVAMYLIRYRQQTGDINEDRVCGW
jgi:hypothetical protein